MVEVTLRRGGCREVVVKVMDGWGMTKSGCAEIRTISNGRLTSRLRSSGFDAGGITVDVGRRALLSRDSNEITA